MFATQLNFSHSKPFGPAVTHDEIFCRCVAVKKGRIFQNVKPPPPTSALFGIFTRSLPNKSEKQEPGPCSLRGDGENAVRQAGRHQATARLFSTGRCIIQPRSTNINGGFLQPSAVLAAVEARTQLCCSSPAPGDCRPVLMTHAALISFCAFQKGGGKWWQK